MKKLFTDVRDGDLIRLPDVSFSIDKIEPMDQHVSTQSAQKLLVVYATCSCGPFKGHKGKFVIAGSDKVEVVKKFTLLRRIWAWLRSSENKPAFTPVTVHSNPLFTR